MTVAEFDEHLLLSTGSDGRVRAWQRKQLVGDFNVNVKYILFSCPFPIVGISQSTQAARLPVSFYKD